MSASFLVTLSFFSSVFSFLSLSSDDEEVLLLEVDDDDEELEDEEDEDGSGSSAACRLCLHPHLRCLLGLHP